tara:strand:- start:1464 stop:1766 length:303 start_codon:yes stop_codon:yes gene_type:complete
MKNKKKNSNTDICEPLINPNTEMEEDAPTGATFFEIPLVETIQTKKEDLKSLNSPLSLRHFLKKSKMAIKDCPVCKYPITGLTEHQRELHVNQCLDFSSK